MFENIVTEFDNLEGDKDYWFIRTMKGKHFEPFKAGGFIGINWNYLTAEDLNTKTEREIRDIIALNERDKNGNPYDIRSSTGRSKMTSIYNKLQRFKNLKKGDFIIIPSGGSSFLAFGVVIDDEIFNNFEDSKCDLFKRRKIHWITTKRLEELDTIFYKIIFTKHAISKLNNYSSYIDKIVSSIFVKDGRSHLVLQVNKQEDINYDALNGVLQDVRSLTSLINEEFLLGEDLTENVIKLNVQSPGLIEFIYKTGRSLLISSIFLAAPISVISCADSEAFNQKDKNIQIIKETIKSSDRFNDEEKEALYKFTEVNIDLIERTKSNMNEIESIVGTN